LAMRMAEALSCGSILPKASRRNGSHENQRNPP
jgi:hypothetical protein